MASIGLVGNQPELARDSSPAPRLPIGFDRIGWKLVGEKFTLPTSDTFAYRLASIGLVGNFPPCSAFVGELIICLPIGFDRIGWKRFRANESFCLDLVELTDWLRSDWLETKFV